MAEQQMDTHVPQRTLCAPQPVAQTVSGILDHTGLPSPLELITDVGPDFSWMSSMEIYRGTFKFSHLDTGYLRDGILSEKGVFNPLYKSELPQDKPAYLTSCNPDWHIVPFSTSRFWNGPVTVRFLAIKPPRVVGKLLIRWIADFSNDYSVEKDTMRRGVKFEWDLGLSNECTISYPGLNPIGSRPTWLPRYSDADDDSTFKRIKWNNQNFYVPSFNLGVLSVEVAQRLVPGSIFPDQVRILVFVGFPGAQFFSPVDPRSSQRHCLTDSLAYRVGGSRTYPNG